MFDETIIIFFGAGLCFLSLCGFFMLKSLFKKPAPDFSIHRSYSKELQRPPDKIDYYEVCIIEKIGLRSKRTFAIDKRDFEEIGKLMDW